MKRGVGALCAVDRCTARAGITIALLLTSACSATQESAKTPAPKGSNGSGASDGATGFYSLAQADRGRETYREFCAECHALNDFRGGKFEWRWRRQTAWDLFRRVRKTMPEDMPGVLSDQGYTDVIAYVLSLNAYPSGPAELRPTEQALEAVPLGPGADKNPTQSR